MCCSVLQLSVLQCVAVCGNVLQCVALHYDHEHEASAVLAAFMLQYVAVCCSVWQCVAVCCSVLQCVALHYDHEHERSEEHTSELQSR